MHRVRAETEQWHALASALGYGRLYIAGALWFYVLWSLLNYVVASDTLVYYVPGIGLFRSFTFGMQSPDGIWSPTASRVPFCSVLLGALHVLLQDQDFTYFAFVLIQVFAMPVIPCAGYYFGRKLDKTTAVSAYLFLLLHANVIMCMLLVLSDAWFAVLSALTYIVLWKALESRKTKGYVFAGLAMGVTSMVRPIMKLYLGVVFLLAAARERRPKAILLHAATVSSAFLIAVSPWLIRNAIHFGKPVFNTLEGQNLLWTNWDLVRLKKSDSPRVAELKRRIQEYGQTGRIGHLSELRGEAYWRANELAVSEELKRVAYETYRENAGAVAKRWIRNFYNMTISPSHYDELQSLWMRRPAYLQIRNSGILFEPSSWERKFVHLFDELRRVIRISYHYLAWIGLALVLLRKPFLGLFFALNILYFTGITAIVAGYDRYRLNIEVFYAVLIVYPVAILLRLSSRLLSKTLRNIRRQVLHSGS